MSALDGRGQIAGHLHPEYGPNVYSLRCDSCGAGWCGEPGEPCAWCARDLEQLRADQRRDLLRPDWLPDPDDRRWESALRTLAERLVRAVEAGLVTDSEARAAISRLDKR